MLNLKRQSKQRLNIQMSMLEVWFKWQVDFTRHGGIQNYCLAAKNQTMPQSVILAFGQLCADVHATELPRCREEFDRELTFKILDHPGMKEDLIRLTTKDVKNIHERLKIIKSENNGILPVLAPDSHAAQGVIRLIPFSLDPYRKDVLLEGTSGVTAMMGPLLTDTSDETSTSSSPIDYQSRTAQPLSNPTPAKEQHRKLHILEAELQCLKVQFGRMQNELIFRGPKVVMKSVSTIRDVLYAMALMLESNFEGMDFLDRLRVIRYELRIPGPQLNLRDLLDSEQEQANVRIVGDFE